ncbi:DUF2865 domain-containing protein [Acuticoccus sediminis]|uniref:DUF2865 domain-containing protein n=1 Tax=Acuticoccus sediminis TaxID=2184697 RepID=UPI001CFDACB8|nr:DUF2865 domain-containing protein [Acuticoccus sediminis]
MSRLQAQHKAYRCDLPSRFGRHQACAGIDARLRDARSGGNSRQIASLQRRVNDACSTRVVQQRERAPQQSTMMIGGRVVTGVHTEGRRRGGGFFSNLFGGDRNQDVEYVRGEPARGVERLDLGEARPARNRAASSDGTDAYTTLATTSGGRSKGNLRVGNSRTVCVRLCDGFYFPINNNSHSDNYYDELAMCVGRCPGADVSLYAHSNGSPVESMRSTMTGERYVNLPTAFSYRKQIVPGCGCQPMSTGAPDDATVDQVVASMKDEAVVNASAATATATDATQSADWTPYQATYDETGKPLPPLKTDRNSEPPERLMGLSLPEYTPRKRSGSATSVAMDGSDDFRDVGPQFYSENGPVTPIVATRTRATGFMTTAVTVIPLGTTTPRNGTPAAVSPAAISGGTVAETPALEEAVDAPAELESASVDTASAVAVSAVPAAATQAAPLHAVPRPNHFRVRTGG